jgi:hypothetical protein
MNQHSQRAIEEYVERQARHIGQIHSALAQAHCGQGIALADYVERSIADGTVTRKGYERALTEELADAQVEKA